jgi:hypothetical protein
MKLTNLFDIPHAFTVFEEKNAYSKGDSDISVTTLIDSPQIRVLKEAYDDELTEDISDRIMSILGTALHNILESGARDVDIVERRLYAEVDGTTISGAIDLFEYMYTDEDKKPHYRLADYKSLSGNALVFNPDGKIEWFRQLNCYNWLAHKNGFVIDELEIVAIIRDWNHAAVRRSSSFPKKAVQRIPIKMWSLAETEKYIAGRVKVHTSPSVGECSESERWSNGAQYAVFKVKRDGSLPERAARVFKSSFDAEAFIMEKGIKGTVIERPSVDTRCVGNYCQVSQYCEQYIKKGNV